MDLLTIKHAHHFATHASTTSIQIPCRFHLIRSFAHNFMISSATLLPPTTPDLKLRALSQINDQTLFLTLPHSLVQTHNSLLDLKHCSTSRITEPLLHTTSVCKHNIDGLIPLALHKRLESLDPVSYGSHIRLRRFLHEFSRTQMAEPRHGYADQGGSCSSSQSS